MRKSIFLIFILILPVIIFGCGKQVNDEAASVSAIPAPYVPSVSSLSPDLPETEESVEEEPEPFVPLHIRLSLTDSGYDIFNPSTALPQDYRYGPSILLEDDGSIDAWFSSPADGEHEFDWITFKHSDDGGENWDDERVVLSPTPNSPDMLSVCDPDVFYYDGYYYLGYTSTVEEAHAGMCNSVFIARSEKPEGPYEKWNGSGWGGDPAPLIYYDGVNIGWGCGEPSFVIVDDILYVYITKDSYSPDYVRIKATEVYTADIRSENWPEKLDYRGIAVNRTDSPTDIETEYVYSDCDSWDVAYIEENRSFVAVCTNRRFKNNSCLLYYESADGINFERVAELGTNTVCGCHNCGIMGDKYAHIKPDDPMLIGYAYSGSNKSGWGIWATRFAPLEIELSETPYSGEDDEENLKLPKDFAKQKDNASPVALTVNNLITRRTAGSDQTFDIGYYILDSKHNMYPVNKEDLQITGYDEDIVAEEDGQFFPKSEGMTTAIAEYEGLCRHICFCSLPEGISVDSSRAGGLMELVSPVNAYKISSERPFATAIRPLARFKNYDITELSTDELTKYGVTITSADETICVVREDFVITPISKGTTTLTVSCSSGESYDVTVNIT